SQNISGWTVEISADGGGEPFVVPYEDPQPIEVGTMLEDGSIRVDEGGIAFTIPADLQIKRVLMQSQVGPLVYGRQCAFPNSINFLMEHEGEESLSYWEKSTLAVYPYALNESIYNYWDDNVGQELEDLLTNKPDLLTYGSLPWPPMCGAVALFGGAGHYLAFPNGDGLRFITEIAQDDVIFTDTTPFTYMYRGLTTDKNFLVKLDYLHVKIPANAIPAPVSRGDAGMYSAYIQQFEANLAAVPSDEFTPNLDVIDALIRTVTLGDAESVMRLIP
ncbi:MAG TPA: hypothetical protein VHL11_03395, partial [Phototrophicaceae bacterium]|nr:hypothetical protein [Phototrophicaceae bacterium]